MLSQILAGTLVIAVLFILWLSIQLRSQKSENRALKSSSTTQAKPTSPTLPVLLNPSSPTTKNLSPGSWVELPNDLDSTTRSLPRLISQTSPNYLSRPSISSPRRETYGSGTDGLLTGIVLGAALSHVASHHDEPRSYSFADSGSCQSDSGWSSNSDSSSGGGSFGD